VAVEETAQRPRAVLVVEDDRDYAFLVQAMLEHSSPGEFEMTHVDRLAGARARLIQSPPDCVLLDLSLPDAGRLEALADLRAVAPEVPVVILSGLEDEILAITAVQEGAQDYLLKGQAEGHVLRRVIRYAIERKRGETELAHMAMHDPLTGLPNRSLFLDRLTHALAHANRYGGLIAVLFLDLDGFKKINDTFGHFMGDELLSRLADRLRKVLRESDTLARFGGDEFTILCERISDQDDAIATAQRVLGAIGAGFDIGAQHLNVGVSIGIALGAIGYEDPPERLIRDADAAMYEAKQKGGCYQVFHARPPISPRSASSQA
jgi:two-component system cell cycle response regulator